MVGLVKVQDLIAKHGWNTKPSGNGDNVSVEVCPICKNPNHKFYINVSESESAGLWSCKVCQRSGNLYQLRAEIGDVLEGATSIKDVATNNGPISALPD